MNAVSIPLIIILLAALILYLFAVYDLVKNRSKFSPRSNHALWLIVVVFIPVIGPIIYFTFKPQ